MPVTKPLLNHGVPVELLPEFQELVVVVLTVPVKLLLVTCVGGRMFAPTKTWRRWNVKVNHNEKRYATASAIAASAVTSLVLARGHRVEQVKRITIGCL